jgi:hypothetical protein
VSRSRDRRIARYQWNTQEIQARRDVYEELLTNLNDGLSIVSAGAKASSGWKAATERIAAQANAAPRLHARVELYAPPAVSFALSNLDRRLGLALQRLQAGDLSEVREDEKALTSAKGGLVEAMNSDLRGVGEYLETELLNHWERLRHRMSSP